MVMPIEWSVVLLFQSIVVKRNFLWFSVGDENLVARPNELGAVPSVISFDVALRAILPVCFSVYDKTGKKAQ